ncbi:serine/threonine-protein kinase, partial [Streptomyces sp. NPDC013313]|uniref:serine/threonine-protein kinase n=1 Tax=Streptomyces sp. NPDC013313 TaxID=3155603 RepID=UPI0033E37706
GRPEEAVRRYESMRRSAEQADRTETALTLLCEIGYWQQKSGDNAAALRSFSEVLQTAQQELGTGHQLVTVARQRYAEVAGRLPFGSEGGDDGLRDLLATAAAVEAAGDLPRACRMYAEAATRSEQLYGAGSAQALSAYVAQARAAARAEDHTTAADCFGKVLACMESQSRGPGTPEYDTLRAHRDQLVRTTRRTAVRVARRVAELLGDQTQAAPDAACVILARENGAPYANCLAVVNDVPDDVSWREGTPEQWAEVLADLAGQDWEAIAADTDGPVPWMAVPYVAAPSLQELTDRCGPLDDDLVRVLGAGIAVALSAIHAEGIVHLDLKPANVLLTEDGPRVIDFGIAQIERITEPRRGFTGTYAYASPEQLREQRSFTPASDIFSLGTLIARLMLGRSPWGGDTPTVVAAIRSGTPDLVGLPEDLAAVVRSCLHPDPDRRPAASDVAEALVPGAGHGKIKAPALSAEARTLVTERATRPHATLPYTRARRSSADSTHHPTTG